MAGEGSRLGRAPPGLPGQLWPMGTPGYTELWALPQLVLSYALAGLLPGPWDTCGPAPLPRSRVCSMPNPADPRFREDARALV